MGKFSTKASTAQKGNSNAAKGRDSEPINSASYAAAVRRGLVATGPPAHAAEETREVYEGGRNNHQVHQVSLPLQLLQSSSLTSFMQLLQ